MKNKILFISLLLLVTTFSVSVRTYGRIQQNDTLRPRIDSILQAKFRADSLNVYAEVEDSNMPEGWFSLLRFDTTNGVLFWGNSYVYKGKNKYLTNYYFINDQLICTQTSKVPIKNQESKKYRNWERNCSYWNDSLIYSFTTDNEDFNYKQELSIAYEILRRFKFLYTTKRLMFEKGSNIGHFK